ncbi:MAG: right-handed parallel beta-helix repeat-containing protein [Actinomycetota bacterium]|nr:right-handed parallel beta-helix repeat-containing protein [Actinomycetota bacterium]
MTSRRRLSACVWALVAVTVIALSSSAGASAKKTTQRGGATAPSTTLAPITTSTTTAPTRSTTTAPTTSTTTAPTTSTTPTPGGNIVYVADYGATTASLQAAADAAAGGTLVFPAGQLYTLTAPITLPSNVVVLGNLTTLRTQNNSTTTTTNDALLDIGAASGVDVSGLVFDGNIANQTAWSQWRHAVRVMDASNVRIHDNIFVNLQGDGIYISHLGATTTPCSSAIDIYDNQFIGSHQNRNGISLVCAEGVKIHQNSFSEMSRPDMPGSIDMEPNIVSDLLNDIQIYGNTIDAGTAGPAYAQYGILVFDRGAHAPVTNVSVYDNTIRGPQLKWAIEILDAYAADVTIKANDIKNLTFQQHLVGVQLEQGATATVTNNVIDNIDGDGIQTYDSCLIESGDVIANVTESAIRLNSPTC